MNQCGKFKSTSTDKAIRDIIRDVEDNIIFLDPNYQRKGTVWSLENKMDFIDSVYTGIVPSRVLYNVDKKHRYICIDGKQRITTLKEFRRNEFPFKLGDEHVFYNNINDAHNIYANARTFNDEERIYYDTRIINVLMYHNLCYDDQLKIFLKINKGVQLTNGELVMTSLSEDTGTVFKQLCDDNEPLFAKFYNIKRQTHYDFMRLITTIYCKNYLCIPDNKILVKYFENNSKLIKSNLPDLFAKIKIIFGHNFLGHDDISKKLPRKNIFTTFIYCLLFDNILVNDIDFRGLRISFNKILTNSRLCNMNSGTNSTNLSNIRNIILEIVKENTTVNQQIIVEETKNNMKLVEKVEEIIDEVSSEESEEVIDEISNEESEEYVDTIKEFAESKLRKTKSKSVVELDVIYKKYSSWFKKEYGKEYEPNDKQELLTYFKDNNYKVVEGNVHGIRFSKN